MQPASCAVAGLRQGPAGRLTILHVRDSKGIYGAERVILTLARNLDVQRYRVLLLCLRDRWGRSRTLEQRATEAGVRVRSVEAHRKLDLHAIRALRKAVIETGTAVIQTHDYKSDMYAVAATRGLGVRRVVTVHGSTRETLRKRLYLGLTERLFYRYFDRIVPVSEPLADALRAQGTDSARLTVIANGFDPGLLEAAADGPGEAPLPRTGGPAVFTVIGRLFPDKGHGFFLEALASLAQRHPEASALIVGEGPARAEIERKVAELGLGERVTLCGARSDMRSVYEASGCVVIPSLREGLPYVLLEALWCRKPVVATAVGDIPALVLDGETGYLVPPADARSLANGMARVLDAPETSAEMGVRGHRLVAEQYSASRMARRYEAVYEEIVSGSEKGARAC